MSLDIELFRIPQHSNVVRVMVRTYKGSAPFLDMRIWYGVDELKPGKGVTMPEEAIPSLAEALLAYTLTTRSK